MTTSTIGVLAERAPGEHRVALVPDVVTRLRSLGLDVLVEAHAGARAWFEDGTYAAAGATTASREEVYAGADVILCVQTPGDTENLRPGQALAGLLEPAVRLDAVRAWVERGITAVSLDLLPRTLSRAQSMDALTSQANVAGYRSAVVAAATFGGYFPMLTTAAGTSRPAAVLVLGAGVAGLQAIGTAHRLGAVVTAYDVRPESRAEIESVGGRFLELDAVTGGSGSGGYARALTPEEVRAQQDALAGQIARFDVVISTARVPGRRPPVLVTEDALKGMRPGSVVLDIAAGELGGNVVGSIPDTTVVTEGGVTVMGAGNLPSSMAPAASAAYARNVGALLAHLTHDGEFTVDPSDEIAAAVVVTHAHALINPDVARLLTGGAS